MSITTTKAHLLRSDALSPIPVEPENKVDFQLEELYKMLDVEMIEIVQLGNGRVLVIDEEGKINGKPYNGLATVLYNTVYAFTDIIVGHALYCRSDQLK